MVRLADEPTLMAAQDVTIPAKETPNAVIEDKATAPSSGAHSNVPAATTTTSELKSEKRGLLQRINPLNLFRSGSKEQTQQTAGSSSGTHAGAELAVAPAQPGGATPDTNTPTSSPGARYTYLSPEKPTPGQRSQAESVFASAAQDYRAGRLSEAVQGYERATQLDPSYYEAYYNLGLAQTHAGHIPAALRAYEYALAIRPDSLDARYNFAFELKQQGYWEDAVEEFEKLVAAFPNEARVHLALGNLYSQQLNQPARARQHYLRMLELAPHDPQSDKIRYWLAANPP
jgi:TolA-binding protein